MNSDDSDNDNVSPMKRFSVNTSLSAIFSYQDEDSSESTDNNVNSMPNHRNEGSGQKAKKNKLGSKKVPYPLKLNKKNLEYEKDPEVLERRQKQIDYGKNTQGYDNYVNQVPRNKRTADHPKTPVKYYKYSRRGWDGLIKCWRQKLHEFDPDVKSELDGDLFCESDDEDSMDIKTDIKTEVKGEKMVKREVKGEKIINSETKEENTIKGEVNGKEMIKRSEMKEEEEMSEED